MAELDTQYPIGWVCPICRAVNSPYADQCPTCVAAPQPLHHPDTDPYNPFGNGESQEEYFGGRRRAKIRGYDPM
jgi:hypothetical protein